MMRAPLPENELERLLSLHEHDVLDSPPEQSCDQITALAAQLCEVPLAAICLLDHDRQWFKSLHGMPTPPQLSREIAICGYTILGSSVFEVADTSRDVRFRGNPMVTGELGVRFYAGAPVRDRRGLALGTLCVFDRRPRQLTDAQRTGLADLAGLAGALLQQRPQLRRFQQAEDRLTAVAQVADEVFREWDLRTDALWLSDKFTQLTGISSERIDGTTWFELVHPDDRERVRACMHSAMLGGDRVYSDEYRIRTAAGAWLSVLDRGQVIHDAGGNAVRFVGCLTDVTWRRDEQRLIGRRDRRQGLIARLGQQALEDTDADALMEHAVHLVAEAFDTRYCRVLEMAEQGRDLVLRAVVGSAPLPAASGHTVDGTRAEATQAGRVDALISGPQGPLGVVEMQLADPAAATVDARHFLQTVANIIGTSLVRKRADQRLAYVAQFDSLTGLPNRQLFRDRVEQSIARAGKRGRPVAVAVVDLDGFKLLNNGQGYAAGDRVLVHVAERLISCVGMGGTVGRLGADEFGLVLWGIADADEVRPVLEAALLALSKPFDVGDGEAFMSASAGVAMLNADGDDAVTLMRNAELAMHRAKEKGRNTYEYFAPELNHRGRERMQLEWSLRRAVERGEFLLHYQPKIAVDTWSVCGVEALLRWQHPERGLVGPAEFIPVLEETGLIVPVGLWVLEETCRQIGRWERDGVRVDHVGVNLSARQFQQPDLEAQIRRTIESAGVRPQQIEFEITESMLMHNPVQAKRTLTALKQLGVSLSVDDFGTGYSSLSYLKQFPLDALKIAQNFIASVTHSESDAAIALAIIDLAHNLKLKVVAEGVESEAQASFLAAHHCDAIQGHFISPAVSPESIAVLDMIREEAHRVEVGEKARAGRRPRGL